MKALVDDVPFHVVEGTNIMVRLILILTDVYIEIDVTLHVKWR